MGTFLLARVNNHLLLGHVRLCNYMYNEALPGVFGDRGTRAFISGEQEQRPNFEGNRGTKTILGNREHKKTNL